MEAFAWLNQLIEFLGSLIPRLLVIRATEGGVKWVRGSNVVPIGPGMHWYWPVCTEIETLVTARQTVNLQPQTLTTADRRKVVVGAVVVYRVRDVERAIGRINWDVEDTVGDIAQAAVVDVVRSSTLEELMEGDVEEWLTKECRQQLSRYGVFVSRAAFTDLAEARVFRLVQG